MRTILLSSLPVAAILVFASFVLVQKKQTIQDAVSARQVQASVTSKGGHSGSCISLELTNLLKEKITVTIPPGTVFKAGNEPDQDIFVVKEQVIVLNPLQKKTMDASGFCCQLSDLSPGTGSKFSVSVTSNDRLKKLAEHLSRNSYPDHVLQEAVWCVSDNNSVSNIYAEDDASVKPLRSFICQLTGQKENWYTTQQVREVTPERVIVSQPVKVTGNLVYEANKGDNITAQLFGPEGNKITELPSMVTQGTGKTTYGFKLTVKGFPKGIYKVMVYGNSKELLKQEFEI